MWTRIGTPGQTVRFEGVERGGRVGRGDGGRWRVVRAAEGGRRELRGGIVRARVVVERRAIRMDESLVAMAAVWICGRFGGGFPDRGGCSFRGGGLKIY